MRRSAVSIPSNIAEGKMRKNEKEFKQFLFIALGSGAELETQIILAKRLKETKHLDYSLIDSLLSEVMRMLNVFISKLEPSA